MLRRSGVGVVSSGLISTYSLAPIQCLCAHKQYAALTMALYEVASQ